MSSIYSVSSLPPPRATNGNNFTTFDVAAPSIHAIANARIYHTQLEAKKDEWTYSRLKGTLRFGRNWGTKPGDVISTLSNSSTSRGPDSDQYWFTLADETTGKTIWMFQIPATFLYEVDRPFFHVFNGRTRKYGFLFEDDDDAALFAKKVINETCKDSAPKRGRSLKSRTRPFRSKSLTGSAPRSLISSPAPNSFRHISHVGVNRRGIFEVSKDLDAAFKESLIKLHSGVTGAADNTVVVQEHTEFLDSFWKDVDNVRASSSSTYRGISGSLMPATVAVVG